MKNKIKILLLIIIPLILGLGFYLYLPKTIELKENTTIKVEERTEEVKVDYEKLINDLKVNYNNQDIIGLIQIPNVLDEPIVQTTNNDYYLHYDTYKNENINGASFLDYRNKIRESKKLLIYGHSDPYGELPFVKIVNYNNQDFLNNNPYIYLIDNKGVRTFEVFSSYIETKDFDYVNLENFGGLTYKEHLEKLKKKSYVSKDIELTEDSKVLILQTCSFNENIVADPKYQIVIAKEIKEG